MSSNEPLNINTNTGIFKSAGLDLGDGITGSQVVRIARWYRVSPFFIMKYGPERFFGHSVHLQEMVIKQHKLSEQHRAHSYRVKQMEEKRKRREYGPIAP